MLSSVSSTAARAQKSVDPALLKQAKGLEGLFLNTLTSEMFSTIKTDGPFGGGFGEQTWRSMQSEQLADEIAKSGGIGLAAQITQNLLDVQEAAQRAAAATTNPQGASH